MKRNLIGMVAVFAVVAVWLVPAALAHSPAPARHASAPGHRHAGNHDPGHGDHGERCPPGSDGGPYCECPPRSHGHGCQCPPGSGGGDYCECPPGSHGHGCGSDGPRWMRRPGGDPWFGLPTAEWLRVAGAPHHMRSLRI